MVVSAGNLLVYDFSFSYRPDGCLGHLGFDRCHAYAKRWAATGRRDFALEATYPELDEAFQEIREDAERLEFHLLPDHLRGRSREVLPFTGFCTLDESPYTVVEELYPLPDGAYELLHDGPPEPDDKPDCFRNLEAPVATVRLLQLGDVRLPCKVIIEHGGSGHAWVTIEALSEAHALAQACLEAARSRTAPRSSRSGTGCPKPGESV